METIYREGALSVSANIALSVRVCARALAESLTEYTFDLAWDAESTEAGQVRVLWELPCIGAQYMWHPDAHSAGAGKRLAAEASIHADRIRAAGHRV